MGDLLIEAAHALGYLFYSLFSGLKRIGEICFYFLRDTFRAHFNLIAQKTAPIEQEIFKKTPPKPSDLNIFGQIALTVFPLTIFSWLLALTLAPLIYNSTLLLISFYIRATNLALLDIPSKKLRSPEGSMAWYRIIYGLPGLLLGTSLGLVSAAFIGFIRVITNSLKTIPYAFVSTINLALDEEDEFKEWEFKQDKRPVVQKYILGIFGLILGGIAGALGFWIIGIGRIISNSYKTTAYLFAVETNLVLDAEDQIDSNDRRPWAQKYLLGVFGILPGILLGALGFTAAGFGRILSNSWKTGKELTISGANLTRSDYEPLAGGLANDRRPFLQKYILGFPGLVLGMFTALLAIGLGSIRRIFIESVKTTRTVFITISNQALAEEDQITYPLQLPRSFVDRYVLGVFGLAAGIISGSLSFMAIIAARVVSNSVKTIIGMNNAAYNLAVHKEDALKYDIVNDSRSPLGKFLLGFPGLIVGLFTGALAFTLGCLGRVISESFMSLQEGFVAITNQALPENETMELENRNRSPLDRFVFGIPGLIGGVIAGFAGFLLVGAARIVINSIESAAHSFASVTNLALHKEDRFKNLGLNIDSRPPRITYGLGLPGIILGGIAGAVGFIDVIFGRIITNSFKTAISLSVTGINVAVHKEEELKAGLQHEKRPLLQTYILGFPGLLLGIIPAGISFLIAVSRRIIIETAKTSRQVAIILINEALHENDQIKKSSDKRRFIDQYLFGAPGLMGGLVLGSIGFLAVGAMRIFSNSLLSAAHSFAAVTNLVLDKEDKIELNDARRPSHRYGLGLPGIIIGTLAGSLGLATVILGRSLGNSLKTAYKLTVTAINAVNYDGETIQGDLQHDQRPNIRKYGFGFPGLLLGSISGLAAIVFTIGRRALIESIITGTTLFKGMVNQVLPEDSHLKTGGKARSSLDKILGLPGILLGSVAGVLGCVAIGLGRSISNSFATAASLSISAYNLLRHQNEQADGGLDQDSRPAIKKYVWGFPGLIFGSITAGFALLLAAGQRIVVESWQTSVESFVTMANLTASPEEEIPLSKKPRSFADRFLFGAPGLLLGGIPGAFALTVSGIVQVLVNSIQSGRWTFIVLTNLGLSKENEFAYPDRQEEAKRSLLGKSLLGLPGIIFGSILGAFALFTILSAKFVYHNVVSWLSLSGSLLNAALELPVFSGLAGDKRDQLSKIAGLWGYGLALAVTLPISASILFFRKVVPVLLALVLGFVCSPLIAALKGLGQAVKKPRFEPDAPAADMKEQKFKNIYSSLTAWGQLPENGQISEAGNGRKGAFCFTRKAFTFNTSTMTEYCLDQLLAAYRGSTDKENFFEKEFPDAVEAIKEHYRVFSCIELQQETEMREEQIDDIAQFVKDYIKNGTSKVPAIYSKPEHSWSSIFWGKPGKEKEEEPVPQPGHFA